MRIVNLLVVGGQWSVVCGRWSVGSLRSRTKGNQETGRLASKLNHNGIIGGGGGRCSVVGGQ